MSELKWSADKPIYVVCEYKPIEEAGERNAWTVSPDPETDGWETDCGYYGYGLPREVAERIVALWNAAIPSSPPTPPKPPLS